MDFSKMNKAEIEQIMEEAKKRLEELKNEEASLLLNNLRPKSFVRLKGKRSEKIGKVLMIGEGFLILHIMGEKERKQKVPYTMVNEVFPSEKDALEALKYLEDKEEVKEEVLPPAKEEKKIFGKKK